jgi:Putative prokaryotic signal transducing protein
MDVTRESLTEKFSEYNNDELLELCRSGDLTELATDVAKAELAKRGLDTARSALTLPPAQPVFEPEPEPAIEGDLVEVARLLDPTEGEMLRGRLEAEGVPAIVADRQTATQVLYRYTIGGVRILVPEAYLERAREVVKADARGDYAIDDRTDVGPPSDNA